MELIVVIHHIILFVVVALQFSLLAVVFNKTIIARGAIILKATRKPRVGVAIRIVFNKRRGFIVIGLMV